MTDNEYTRAIAEIERAMARMAVHGNWPLNEPSPWRADMSTELVGDTRKVCQRGDGITVVRTYHDVPDKIISTGEAIELTREGATWYVRFQGRYGVERIALPPALDGLTVIIQHRDGTRSEYHGERRANYSTTAYASNPSKDAPVIPKSVAEQVAEHNAAAAEEHLGFEERSRIFPIGKDESPWYLGGAGFPGEEIEFYKAWREARADYVKGTGTLEALTDLVTMDSPPLAEDITPPPTYARSAIPTDGKAIAHLLAACMLVMSGTFLTIACFLGEHVTADIFASLAGAALVLMFATWKR